MASICIPFFPKVWWIGFAALGASRGALSTLEAWSGPGGEADADLPGVVPDLRDVPGRGQELFSGAQSLCRCRVDRKINRSIDRQIDR